MIGLKQFTIDFLFSEPVEELRQKCYEVSGIHILFNRDEFDSFEDYISKLIEYAGLDWKFEIIQTSNSPKMELKLYKSS